MKLYNYLHLCAYILYIAIVHGQAKIHISFSSLAAHAFHTTKDNLFIDRGHLICGRVSVDRTYSCSKGGGVVSPLTLVGVDSPTALIQLLTQTSP